MIGIGGASMSGLALMLHQMGYQVTGSSNVEDVRLNQLREKGIRIYIGHSAEHVRGADLVVFTTAVGTDNPELAACYELGIPVIDRPKLLGFVNEAFSQSISVCGTHGKTTTTSMLAEILVAVGTDPTIHIGGQLDSLGRSVRVGDGELFLTEACEYRKGFLHLHPTMEIILNIDEDHMDCFRNIDEIEEAFRQFIQRLPEDAVAIGNGDDYRVLRQLRAFDGRSISFGWVDDFDYRSVNYHENDQGSVLVAEMNCNQCIRRINI